MATEQLLKPHHREHVQPDVRGARHLADARLVLPGGDRPSATPERDERRFLTTILMTDIVDSTHTAACLGDRRWCDLLTEHYADCGALVARGRGQLVTTTGDGIVATFDTPACAVRAAIAIQEAARQFAIAVRAGVHTGECERHGGGLAGIAVHITERICALAGADEVLTTGTVHDLVIGSLLAFEPRGTHQLRGVPREWTVFSATDP